MDLAERNDEVLEFYASAFTIIKNKGADYEPSGIAFQNLKAEAKELGVTPLQFLLTHASKHWAALRSYVQNNGQLESEDISSRLMDLANYAALFHCLIIDAKLEKENASST